MKKLILVIAMAMLGCQANAWDLKDLGTIADEIKELVQIPPVTQVLML
ncbi:MAG: hypothetical protein ACMZ63_04110 [Methylotenera sp.]